MNSNRFLDIYREEIVDLTVKSYTGQNSCLISYVITVLETWSLGLVVPLKILAIFREID